MKLYQCFLAELDLGLPTYLIQIISNILIGYIIFIIEEFFLLTFTVCFLVPSSGIHSLF